MKFKLGLDNLAFSNNSDYYKGSAYEAGQNFNTKYHRGDVNLSEFLNGLDTDLVISELKKMGKL